MSDCMGGMAYIASNLIGNGPQEIYYDDPPSIAATNRFKAEQARSPRTSVASKFIASVAQIANRVVGWVKQVNENVKQKISADTYDRACRDSMRALELIIHSNDPHCIRAQAMVLISCRKRQRNFLQSQDKSIAKDLDQNDHRALSTLINSEGSRKKLEDHRRSMQLSSILFQSVIPGRTEQTRAEYFQANLVIEILLKNSAARLMENQSKQKKIA